MPKNDGSVICVFGAGLYWTIVALSYTAALYSFNSRLAPRLPSGNDTSLTFITRNSLADHP